MDATEATRYYVACEDDAARVLRGSDAEQRFRSAIEVICSRHGLPTGDLRKFNHGANLYRTEDVPTTLAAACPDGIDVYFDNVGGEILDTCLKLMNFKGCIPTCGLISQYNATEPVPGPNSIR